MAQITTVIPTYRRPELLRRAILSVLNQTYRDFRICVYDNASNDETGMVVRQIAGKDPRVSYFCHPYNIGLMENFAFGAGRIDSPYFNLLSDDDILLPDFFETAMKAFAKSREARIFAGALLEADSRGCVLRAPFESWREGLMPVPEAFISLLRCGTATWTSMLFSREVLEQRDGPDAAYGPGADVDFELRVLSRYPAIYSSTPCAAFFIHPGGVSSNYRVDYVVQSVTRLRRELPARLPNSPPSVHRTMLDALNAHLVRRVSAEGRLAAALGELETARRFSELLERELGAPGKARQVRRLASWSIMRRPFLALRHALHGWRRLLRRRTFAGYQRLLAANLERLGKDAAAIEGESSVTTSRKL